MLHFIKFIDQYTHIDQANMFDFLQKLSHQHPQKPQQQKQQEKQKLNPPSPPGNQKIINQKSSQKIVKQQPAKQIIQNKIQKTTQKKPKQISLSAQLQLGQTAQLDPEVLRILQRIRDESEKRVNQRVLGMLHQQKNKVQRKVYLRQMSHNFEQYLEEVLAQSSSSNRYVRHGLALTVNHVANAIYEDILNTNKYEVTQKANMTKDDLALLQNSLAHIRNNQGNVRGKVGELKMILENQSQKIHGHSLEIIEKSSFSANHPKTKQVQVFLKGLQEERLRRKMRYQQSKIKNRQRKIQQEFHIEIERQKAKSQRHQRLVEAHQNNRKKKQQQFQQLARKNKQFQQWVKIYRKRVPLYKQKQKQFEQNFLEKEYEERYNKLLKRKQIYHPMEFQQFEEHQQQYFDQKKENAVRYRAQLKMRKQQQKQRQEQLDGLHKGKFRYYVLEQMVAKKEAKDPKQQLINKKIKQLEYSQYVKSLHKPKIDPAKKFQMEMLNSSSNKKKNRYKSPQRMQASSAIQDGSYHRSYSYGQQQQQRDPKIDGERNRRYFKQYIRQKIERGQIKKKQDQRPATLTPKPPNYLHQMRSMKQSGIRKAQTIDHEIQSIKRKQDISALLAQVSHHDSKAQRLQQKFKHAVHKPQQEAALQDNYLFSIKAKLQLLKNYD